MASTTNSPELTLLDVVNVGDNIHLSDRPLGLDVSPFDSERLVRFTVSSAPDSAVIGLIRPIVLDQLCVENLRSAERGFSEVWEIHDEHVSFSSAFASPPDRTAAIGEMLLRWRDSGVFPDVMGPSKWRDEKYPVYADPLGPHDYAQDGSGNYMFEMERSACAVFGVVTYGVHMSIYEDLGGDVKMWIPRRAQTKQSWPGYLDNTVAGGIPSSCGVLETLINESMEEASIDSDFVKLHAKAVGAVSYFYRLAKGWLQPEVQYVYDLRVPAPNDSIQFQPRPLDGEVESFELMPLCEVIQRMCRGEFKPNSALVVIDFLVRQGYITPDNEPNYTRIMMRLHRKLDLKRW